MEYVANAQGQDVTVATPTESTQVKPAPTQVKPAPTRGDAKAAVAVGSLAADAAPIAVTGVSTIEKMRDLYESEVARVDAEATSLKAFASSVISRGKAEVNVIEVELSKAKTWTITHALTFLVGSSVGVAAQALWKFL